MQNFFDANREELSKVQLSVEGTKVTISAPAKFELTPLFCLYILPHKRTGNLNQQNFVLRPPLWLAVANEYTNA